LIEDIYQDFDVVQIFHSCPVVLEMVKDHPHLVVYHSGTRYRNNPEEMNELFNPLVKFSVTDQTEFMKLGAKNLSYIAPHVEVPYYKKPPMQELIVSHYPSNPWVKGTDAIRAMLSLFEDRYHIRIDDTHATHEENLLRMRVAHIYVELFKPTLDGKPYGCFGVTAFEAMAMGCLVVTNDFHPEVYREVYGAGNFLIANTAKEFIDAFTYNIPMIFNFPDVLQRGVMEFRERHSALNTGKRIIQITQ
jgi:glycosyltransferase involved in cell wall biosynthesis